MEFVTGESLLRAFHDLREDKRLYCAVAFWGKGAGDLCLGDLKQNRDVRIICNLKMGGTNPDEIKHLLECGAVVQQDPRLHAKVYIGDTHMLVTSANASANGLGFEGEEQAAWTESGMYGEIQPSVLSWFKERWSASQKILPEDLRATKKIWKQRREMRPSAVSFADFNPQDEDWPLVEWQASVDWAANEPGIKKMYGKHASNIIKRVDDAIDRFGPKDDKALKLGLWVLRWTRTAKGRLHAKTRIEWVRVGAYHVKKAYYYNDKPRAKIDVVLPAEVQGQPPFDASEQRFRFALGQVLAEPEFKTLSDESYDEWFTPERTNLLLPAFWAAVKRAYDATT